MGIRRVTSSALCLVLVVRVERSLFVCTSGAGKLLGVPDRMSMKLQSKLGELTGATQQCLRAVIAALSQEQQCAHFKALAAAALTMADFATKQAQVRGGCCCCCCCSALLAQICFVDTCNGSGMHLISSFYVCLSWISTTAFFCFAVVMIAGCDDCLRHQTNEAAKNHNPSRLGFALVLMGPGRTMQHGPALPSEPQAAKRKAAEKADTKRQKGAKKAAKGGSVPGPHVVEAVEKKEDKEAEEEEEEEEENKGNRGGGGPQVQRGHERQQAVQKTEGWGDLAGMWPSLVRPGLGAVAQIAEQVSSSWCPLLAK
eukprot:1160332-Pelagomonas_calceolata.AAC.2